jgi:hypothetical protein
MFEFIHHPKYGCHDLKGLIENTRRTLRVNSKYHLFIFWCKSIKNQLQRTRIQNHTHGTHGGRKRTTKTKESPYLHGLHRTQVTFMPVLETPNTISLRPFSVISFLCSLDK